LGAALTETLGAAFGATLGAVLVLFDLPAALWFLLTGLEVVFFVAPALPTLALDAGDFDWPTLRIFEGVIDLRDAFDLVVGFLPFAPFRAPLEPFLLAAEAFLFTAFVALFLAPDVFFVPALDLVTVDFLPLVVFLDPALAFAADDFLDEVFAPVFLVAEPFFDPVLDLASPVVLRVDGFFDPALAFAADVFLTDVFDFVDFFPAVVFFSPALAFAEEVFLFAFLETSAFELDFVFEDADFLLVASFFDPDLDLLGFAFKPVLDLGGLEVFLPAIDFDLAFLALGFDAFTFFGDFLGALEVLDLDDLDILPALGFDALAFFGDFFSALEFFDDLTALEALVIPFAVLAVFNFEPLTPLAFFVALALALVADFDAFPLVTLVLFRFEAALGFTAFDFIALRDAVLPALRADLPDFAPFVILATFPLASLDPLRLEVVLVFATFDLLALREAELLALVLNFAFFVALPFADVAAFPLANFASFRFLVAFNAAAFDLVAL
jgi:hypothetical protein